MSYHLIKVIDRRSGWVLPLATLLFVGGCGDFFAQKPTELQSQVILNELRDIQENSNVENPLPEVYRRPAETIEVSNGFKLFYFARHHPADKLADLVDTQFSQFFRTESSQKLPKGKEYPKPTYTVSPNLATNQVIIHCPTAQEADKVLEFLHKVDVPPIQVNIDCLILERFADVTTDWETAITIFDLFGEGITLGTKDGPEFPGASLREPRRAEFGLDIGYWNQELPPDEFRVVVDVLISRGYLKVLMNPTLETINGNKATISAREYAPLEKILSQPGFDEPFNLTDYQWVEGKLEVTPHVYADGSIGLETEVKLGSRSKPEGVVQTSIITERSVKVGENRIEPGHSLVIGGVRKSEERSVIRGVPVLKDIPILNILFSSKDFEEKATEIIFILTPSISAGGVEYAKMVQQVRQKYSKPEYESGLHETLTDPLGAGAYTSHIEQQAVQAKFERFKAEIEKAEALQEVNRLKQELLDAAEEVLVERAKAAKAQSDALKARQEAQKAIRKAQELTEQDQERQIPQEETAAPTHKPQIRLEQ